MARRKPLSAEEAEKLFATVDETGHANPAEAERERESRRKFGVGRAVDPLSGLDPSGSNVGTVMARASVLLVAAFVAVIVLTQVSSGCVRRDATAALANEANLHTVTVALEDGVEWGSGFTQFPQDFTVQEADQATGVIEVSVIDTRYATEVEALAASQIQAAALSVNALMNPQINEVIYKVNVHVDDEGNLLHATLFDFLEPAGQVKPFATFTWSKQVTEAGDISLSCSITGIDAETTARLRDLITGADTPLLGTLGTLGVGVSAGDEAQ